MKLAKKSSGIILSITRVLMPGFQVLHLIRYVLLSSYIQWKPDTFSYSINVYDTSGKKWHAYRLFRIFFF